METFVYHLKLGRSTVRRVVNNEIKYNWYGIRRSQFMTFNAPIVCYNWSTCWNKLIQPDKLDMLWFFLNENFDQNQKYKPHWRNKSHVRPPEFCLRVNATIYIVVLDTFLRFESKCVRRKAVHFSVEFWCFSYGSHNPGVANWGF